MNLEDPKTEKPVLSPLALTTTEGEDRFDIAQETLIGREVECTISLDSPHVSRYHAKIIVGADGAHIEDLNSSNGTYVNGKRIKEKTKISLGDELRFDTLSFRVTSKDAGKSDATVVINREALATAELSTGEKSASEKPAAQTLKPEASAAAASNAEAAAPKSEMAAPEPETAEQDDDSTRMLSSEQINKFAEINKQLQKFTDQGSGPRFVAMTAPIRGKVFELDTTLADNLWRFGRSRDCELCVSAPSISRHHGTIRKEDGRFYFKAEPGKTLRVNDQEQSDALLKHNDEVQIGPIEFIFRLDEQEKPESKILAQETEETPVKTILIIAGTGVAILTAVFGFLLLSK